MGKRFWPLTKGERRDVLSLFEEDHISSLVASFLSDEYQSVRVIDAAYWRKGCSSLGNLRLAILIKAGNSSDEKIGLIDIKEAKESCAPGIINEMPAKFATRVVEAARHLSPQLGNRMIAAHLFGKSVFLRELLPQDLKFEIDELSRAEALEIAGYLAHIVGLSHARQLNHTDQDRWSKEIRAGTTKKRVVPEWLWHSVTSLVAEHETAYLEHCRNYLQKAQHEIKPHGVHAH